MVNPFKYRPPVAEAEGESVPDEWEDNPLSNFFAWASQKITPAWCNTPEHWTSRLTGYLFTSCPCCLLFRGIVIGWSLAWIMFLAVALLIL